LIPRIGTKVKRQLQASFFRSRATNPGGIGLRLSALISGLGVA
jgi:hypothetical protein